MTKFIHIDYRAPRTKDEKGLFGQVFAEKDKADIYMNVNKNRNSKDLVDTFFHEMAHVFFAFHGKTKQMTEAEEEKLAQQIGRICAGVLR